MAVTRCEVCGAPVQKLFEYLVLAERPVAMDWDNPEETVKLTRHVACSRECAIAVGRREKQDA